MEFLTSLGMLSGALTDREGQSLEKVEGGGRKMSPRGKNMFSFSPETSTTKKCIWASCDSTLLLYHTLNITDVNKSTWGGAKTAAVLT